MWGPILSAQRTPGPILGVKAMANPIPSCPCRRGSPLLIGVRSEHKLSTEQIPILYRTRKSLLEDRSARLQAALPPPPALETRCP